MPTSNPVPSTDPSDLLFNAGKLDEVVNGTANSFTDRLGVARRTVAGMNADFDAQLADAESDLNVYRADAAASAAEALGYLQTIRATSYGAYASDPATDPLGNPPTVGDEYFNTTANLLKRWNGTTWQASDISTANLAASSGSSLVGYDGGTVQDVLDAVTGPNGAASVGYTPPGTGAVATTVQSKLRETVSVKDFGAVGDGVADDAPAIQAAYNHIVSIGGGTVYLPATKEGYKINTAINCTNCFYGIDFVGAGSASLPNARPNDDSLGTTIWLNTGTVGFDLTGCATLGIRSLTLDTFHTTKVTNPARIGILSGRTAQQLNSFNHRFTDVSVFMKSTGSPTSPSIALFASNVELMTCINCWFHGDVATVLTDTGLYNAASPYVSIINTPVSATCNTLLSCKLISVSGVGPALRLNQTVNNTIIGTYFGNDVDDSTYPAILCTSAVQKLFVKGFQSEGRTEFLKVTGNLIECEFYGTHASTNAITPICNFDNAGNVHDCSFDIYNSATVSGYSAYTGTINYLANSYFNLGYGGNFAVTCTTFQGNSFNKIGAAATYTGIPSVSSDATINGVYQPSFYVRKQDYPFQKTNATNNSQFVFALVVVPNSEVNAIIEIPYTLNSANGQLIRTGRLRVNAARFGGITSVVTMSEEAAQVALQTIGSETITASFAVGSTAGAANAAQTIELTCTINSSLGGAGYIRGIATVQSAYFTNGLVQDHIYLVSA